MLRYIVPLIVSIIYIALLLILIVNRPWNKQHKLFVIYLMAATLWSGSDYFLRSNLFPQYELVIFRIVILASLWWAVQLYHFARSFLDLPGGAGLWLGYGALGILSVLAFTGHAPPAIIYDSGIVSPVYSWWFFFYFAPLLSLATLGVYSLIRRLQTPLSPEERNKANYLTIAAVILATFGLLGVTPLANTFPLSHLGGLLSAAILAYAILQHELVSINLVMRRLLGLVCLSVVIGGIYLLLLVLIFRFFNIEHYAHILIFAVIAGLIVSAFAMWLRPVFMGKLEQLFYREKYQHRHELFSFVKNQINGIFSLQELSQGLLPPLISTLSCQRAYMLLASSVTADFTIELCEPPLEQKSALKIRKDSPIVTALRREYLTREDIEINPEFRSLWKDERNGIKNLGIELLFPLISRQNLIGILALGKKQRGKYSLEDTNLIESIAGQVAISLEREYYHEELRKREQEIALINRLAHVMASSLNIQDVYDAFVSGLKEVIDVNFATISLVEDNDLCFSALSTELSSIWSIGDRIPLKGTATEWVVNHKKSMVEPDLAADRMFTTGEAYLKCGIRSIIYLPLIVKGTGIGSLIIGSRNPGAYSSEQISMLERLASQIATSIDNAQLYAKAEHRARVDELTDLFNRRHFDEVLLQEIQRHSRYGSSFSVAFMDVDNFKSFNDISGHPAGDKLLKQIAHLIKRAIRGIDLAFRYGGDEFAIIMSHTPEEDAYSVTERIRNMVIEDLLVNVTMSIGLASWPNDGLSTDELVNAADTALYHAKRTGGNRTCIISQVLPVASETSPSLNSENESLNTIYALAATIEARDAYTYGHSRKVRSYAVTLAEALDLPAEKVVIISHAALLHDIGKIGIIDGILNKAGALDVKERESIKMHPQLSRNIVAHIPSLTPCLPAIFHHHERWDGNGYPTGLKGEMIPLEARILAIADAFDAMTSTRSYRTALSLGEAIKELEKGAGNQFDPQLIKVFIPLAINFDFQKTKV